jgi:hypothetical protein
VVDHAPALNIHINFLALASILGDRTTPPPADGEPTITITDHKKPHLTPVILSGLVKLGLATRLDDPKGNKHPRDNVVSLPTLVAKAKSSLMALDNHLPINPGISNSSPPPISTPRTVTTSESTITVVGEAPRPTLVDLSMGDGESWNKALGPRSLGTAVARDEGPEYMSSLAGPKIFELAAPTINAESSPEPTFAIPHMATRPSTVDIWKPPHGRFKSFWGARFAAGQMSSRALGASEPTVVTRM